MKNKLRKQILDLINKHMREYANTPLSKRKNAFYELAELEREILELFENRRD